MKMRADLDPENLAKKGNAIILNNELINMKELTKCLWPIIFHTETHRKTEQKHRENWHVFVWNNPSENLSVWKSPQSFVEICTL